MPAGATIDENNGTVTLSGVATNFTVTATSVDNTNCSGTAILNAIKVDVTPVITNVCASSTNTIPFSLTNSFTPGGVKWSIMPAGATIDTNNGAVTLSGVATNFTITATSVDDTNCYGSAVLNAIKVELDPDATNVCWKMTDEVTIALTNSYAPDGIEWSGTNGLRVVSADNSSLVFTPTNSTPTNYIVKASAVGLTDCSDICTVIVLKVDLDVDSDNNNRHDPPDRNQTEDNIEENAPGKIILLNVDDDDGDDVWDKDDDEINGDIDRDGDMADVVVEIRPDVWDTAEEEVILDASTYDGVRVFKQGDGALLLGPEAAVEYELVPTDLTAGVLNLVVEGVEIGNVTLSLIYRRAGGGAEICRDEVRLTVDNTLETAPLGFGHIWQHKDTELLCTVGAAGCPEVAANGHQWDADHGGYLGACPHCAWYCTRASVAMMNCYYEGDLSQDEVSYHSRASFAAGNDLGHGEGLWPREPLAWALGVAEGDIEQQVNAPARSNNDDDWQFIANAVICYRPVLLVQANPGGGLHTCCISGVRIQAGGTRQIRYADPAVGTQWLDFSSKTIERLLVVDDDEVENVVARARDATITADPDGDQVMSFDEANRFSGAPYNLDPNNSDSDGDGDDDFEEIRSVVFP